MNCLPLSHTHHDLPAVHLTLGTGAVCQHQYLTLSYFAILSAME